MLRAMPQLGGQRLAPLPASVLPSSMSVVVVEEGEYGEERADARHVGHVRFERADEWSLQSSGGAAGGYVFREGSKGLVIVDAATSEGAFDVPERAEVSVDGGEPMRVVRSTLRANLDGTPHHWEIEVA